MKKVLSVAMASAMVLGMGANAFAITYNTGSNDTASWPKGFAFDGSLFVTNKDGDIVTDATTAINGEEAVNFEPGDVIWMPLYADNQKVYDVEGNNKGYDEVAATTVYLKPVLENAKEGEVQVDVNGTIVGGFTYTDNVNKVVYYYNEAAPAVEDGWRTAEIKTVKLNTSGNIVETKVVNEAVNGFLAITNIAKAADGSWEFTLNDGTVVTKTSASVQTTPSMWWNENKNGAVDPAATTIKVDYNTILVNIPSSDLKETNSEVTTRKMQAGTAPVAKDTVKSNVKVVVSLPKVEAVKENMGNIVNVDGETDYNDFVNTVAHGHYTGNIDKNWSINLIEKSTGVAELIEKAELYKATKTDYLSYKAHTTEIMPNAVYLKITLEDEWKTTTSETLKYYVYIADNKAKDHKTNEVWVSGKYENTDYEWVNFDWTNDASRSKLWKVHDDENGVAVFDFADKAFFSVKMYGGETMYLDLETAYDKAIAGEMDAEADSFYKFTGSNANFARTGELIIVSDDSSLVPYQIDEDGNFVAVDAEYVENYAVAHTNKKVNGFVFNTKQLGNYVLSTEELGEEEEPAVEEPAVEEPAPAEPVVETPAPETNKPNPNTGAEDFVGLAVSLAVVSVAAAGALALKK